MSPKVQIDDICLGTIFVALQEAFPNEGCGLLLGRKSEGRVEITEIVPSPNLAEDPAKAFEIDPGLRLRTQLRAREQGLQIVGHFHSHPFGEPRPSDCDRAMAAQEPDLIWLIMGMRWGGPQGLAAWHLPKDSDPERLDFVLN